MNIERISLVRTFLIIQCNDDWNDIVIVEIDTDSNNKLIVIERFSGDDYHDNSSGYINGFKDGIRLAGVCADFIELEASEAEEILIKIRPDLASDGFANDYLSSHNLNLEDYKKLYEELIENDYISFRHGRDNS